MSSDPCPTPLVDGPEDELLGRVRRRATALRARRRAAGALGATALVVLALGVVERTGGEELRTDRADASQPAASAVDDSDPAAVEVPDTDEPARSSAAAPIDPTEPRPSGSTEPPSAAPSPTEDPGSRPLGPSDGPEGGPGGAAATQPGTSAPELPESEPIPLLYTEMRIQVVWGPGAGPLAGQPVAGAVVHAHRLDHDSIVVLDPTDAEGRISFIGMVGTWRIEVASVGADPTDGLTSSCDTSAMLVELVADMPLVTLVAHGCTPV